MCHVGMYVAVVIMLKVFLTFPMKAHALLQFQPVADGTTYLIVGVAFSVCNDSWKC